MDKRALRRADLSIRVKCDVQSVQMIIYLAPTLSYIPYNAIYPYDGRL